MNLAFTAEQKEYLAGLFAGVNLRSLGLAAEPESAEVERPKPEPENLIFEERVKRELHPLDAYSLLVEHA